MRTELGNVSRVTSLVHACHPRHHGRLHRWVGVSRRHSPCTVRPDRIQTVLVHWTEDIYDGKGLVECTMNDTASISGDFTPDIGRITPPGYERHHKRGCAKIRVTIIRRHTEPSARACMVPNGNDFIWLSACLYLWRYRYKGIR